MSNIKRVFHLLAFIVCGFFVYCIALTVACMAMLVLTHLAWYHIVLGTAIGCGALFLFAVISYKSETNDVD